MRLEAVFQPLILGEKNEIFNTQYSQLDGERSRGKIQILLEDILEKDYDLICFQEINQEMTSSEVEVNDLYQALPAAEPIHQDHYVRLLVEKLLEQGKKLLLDLGL